MKASYDVWGRQNHMRGIDLIESEKILFNKTLLCHHSLESSLRDDSNEWSHHMVWLRNNEVTAGGSLIIFAIQEL